MTTILKFKCESLSDVILNQKAASEGPNQTLDFIPGSNFLGIAAAQLYPLSTGVDKDRKKVYDDEKMRLARLMFHSNDVRFGDAHPANGMNRSLRVPASLYFAKGEKEDERTHYVHHAITEEISKDILKRNIQLKQERSGFVDFAGNPAVRLKQHTNFAIKSAYDADKRRSKDSQMYGYQSMEKGGVFYFSVEIDNDVNKDVSDKIKRALTGTKYIGRSRSAQYGLVEISECNDYQEVQSVEFADNNIVVVYAESRLIFFDDCGIPTFQPSAEQLLGMSSDSGMEIDWSKSQIRTFKYAPYNYVRKCFDTDRCGIEKGSVIVLKRKKNASDMILDLPQWVGSYQNEGFGKVVFNPMFLDCDNDAKLKLEIRSVSPNNAKIKVDNPGTLLTKYVMRCKDRDREIGDIYKVVNEWANGANGKSFQSDSFKSQWGTIRSIAMRCSSKEELEKELFVYDKTAKTGGYLVHGVSEEKWRNKLKALLTFVQAYTPEYVVNLASVMQKKCSENKETKGGTKK